MHLLFHYNANEWHSRVKSSLETRYTMSATLYNTDFYIWAQTQANLLRTEELEKLDLPNLIEEIEAMALRDRRELVNRLIILLMHLLKWQYQPARSGRSQPRSWLNTIVTQRNQIELVLEDSPSLRNEIPAMIVKAYPRACKATVRETNLPASTFPPACPYDIDQILDDDFFPG